MYSSRWITILLLAEMMIKMEKNQIEQLQLELNELSENEKQNLERMKEIAKVLVDYYLGRNDKKS
jgi:hypothetical protein